MVGFGNALGVLEGVVTIHVDPNAYVFGESGAVVNGDGNDFARGEVHDSPIGHEFVAGTCV